MGLSQVSDAMNETLLEEFCKWLAATLLSNTIQTIRWIIPSLQIIHILAVSVVFSSAILVDLRFWRLLQRDMSLPDVARRYLPTIWPILIILLVTGSLMIIGEPRRSLLSKALYLKMLLLVFGLVLTLGLQWSLSASPDFWEKNVWRRVVGKLAATVSTLVWCGILFAGRWIAYSQAG